MEILSQALSMDEEAFEFLEKVAATPRYRSDDLKTADDCLRWFFADVVPERALQVDPWDALTLGDFPQPSVDVPVRESAFSLASRAVFPVEKKKLKKSKKSCKERPAASTTRVTRRYGLTRHEVLVANSAPELQRLRHLVRRRELHLEMHERGGRVGLDAGHQPRMEGSDACNFSGDHRGPCAVEEVGA